MHDGSGQCCPLSASFSFHVQALWVLSDSTPADVEDRVYCGRLHYRWWFGDCSATTPPDGREPLSRDDDRSRVGGSASRRQHPSWTPNHARGGCRRVRQRPTMVSCSSCPPTQKDIDDCYAHGYIWGVGGAVGGAFGGLPGAAAGGVGAFASGCADAVYNNHHKS